MTKFRYRVSFRCYEKIYTFYYHVALKYRHTYSEELMHRNIDDAIDSMYQIEQTLMRRKPTISKWAGCYMANTEEWYFAYTVDGDTITVLDVCHAQNMKER